jgi:hypothetical protein
VVPFYSSCGKAKLEYLGGILYQEVDTTHITRILLIL